MNDEAMKQFEQWWQERMSVEVPGVDTGEVGGSITDISCDAYCAGKQAATQELRQKVEAMCSTDKPSLYGITGNVTDLNTLLVHVSDLRKLVGA